MVNTLRRIEIEWSRGESFRIRRSSRTQKSKRSGSRWRRSLLLAGVIRHKERGFNRRQRGRFGTATLGFANQGIMVTHGSLLRFVRKPSLGKSGHLEQCGT